VILRFWEATTAIRMKTDPYCQQWNCSPLNVLSNGIDYVDIAGRSSARGRQTRVGWEKPAIFELNVSISRKLRARKLWHEGS